MDLLDRLPQRTPGIEIPGYLRPPLPGAPKEVPDGTAAGSPGFQSRAGEDADIPVMRSPEIMARHRHQLLERPEPLSLHRDRPVPLLEDSLDHEAGGAHDQPA